MQDQNHPARASRPDAAFKHGHDFGVGRKTVIE
jgi:hypothetical protein